MRIKWACDGRFYLHFTLFRSVATCSADKTVRVHDTETGDRLKQFKGHTSFINDCDACPTNSNCFASVSDDCTVKVFFIIL